jgi:hypothetical protein
MRFAKVIYIAIAMRRKKCCSAGEEAGLGGKSDDCSVHTSRSDQDMTAFAEHAHELGTTFPPAADAQTATHRVATLKSRLANFWPPALIALGLALTLSWNVGLVWLLYELI